MKALKQVGMTTKTIVKVALLSALLVGHAHATQCPLVPSSMAEPDVIPAEKLAKKYLGEIEARLAKLHKTNLASDGGDLLTLRQIANLQTLNAMNDDMVLTWVNRYPHFFFGQLNAGIYFSNKATDARGPYVISKTSRKALDEMRQLNEVAIGYLLKAMELDASSALPQSILLVIAAQQGEAVGKTAEQWLQVAIQTDPKNLAARIQATFYLSPRWGGSFELLDHMAQEAEKSLSAQEAYYLRYNIVLQKAYDEEDVTQNISKAHWLYKQAKSMCENSPRAQEGIVRTYQKSSNGELRK